MNETPEQQPVDAEAVNLESMADEILAAAPDDPRDLEIAALREAERRFSR